MYSNTQTARRRIQRRADTLVGAVAWMSGIVAGMGILLDWGVVPALTASMAFVFAFAVVCTLAALALLPLYGMHKRVPVPAAPRRPTANGPRSWVVRDGRP